LFLLLRQLFFYDIEELVKIIHAVSRDVEWLKVRFSKSNTLASRKKK